MSQLNVARRRQKGVKMGPKPRDHALEMELCQAALAFLSRAVPIFKALSDKAGYGRNRIKNLIEETAGEIAEILEDSTR